MATRIVGTTPEVQPRRVSRRAAARMALIGGLGLAALRLPSPPEAQGQENTTDFAAALDAFIRDVLPAYDVPGAAVAVVSEGRTIFLRGYGLRRLGEPAPVDENTVFQIASNTKPFTAAARRLTRLGWPSGVVPTMLAATAVSLPASSRSMRPWGGPTIGSPAWYQPRGRAGPHRGVGGASPGAR